MSTLVATLDLDLADPKSKRNINHLRASHGDVTNFNQITIQLGIGDAETYEFQRFFYAHIRDVVDVELTDAQGNTAKFQAVTGVFSLPFAGKVKLSVDSASSITLDRVLHLVFS